MADKKLSLKQFFVNFGIALFSPILLAFLFWALGWYKNIAVKDVSYDYDKKEIHGILKNHQECIKENTESINALQEVVDERFSHEDVKLESLKNHMDIEFDGVKDYINQENKELRNLIINILNGRTSEEIRSKNQGSGKESTCDGYGYSPGTADEVRNTQGLENYWRSMYNCGWSITCCMGTYPPWMDYICNDRPAYFVKWPGNMGWLSNQ